MDGDQKMPSRRNFLLASVAFAMPIRQAYAEEFPTRPIRIIVPTGAGTGTDLTARNLAVGMSKTLGQPVVVENKLGAGGVIGTEIVAKAAPDGYTLLFTYAAHYSNQWIEKTPYDAVSDFEPIARLAVSALVLVVGANSPYHTVQELIAAARKQPGKLTYGSAGTGTTSHMAAALFSKMAGVDLVHIPYKAPSQAAVDAAGGQVDMTFGGLATSLPMIKAGRLRVLAVTTDKRSANLPDVPTLSESGLPGYENSSPVWAFAPRGTPLSIVNVLSGALVKAASTPEFKEFCFAQGIDVDIQGAAQCRADAPKELAKWKALVELTRQSSQ